MSGTQLSEGGFQLIRHSGLWPRSSGVPVRMCNMVRPVNTTHTCTCAW